MSDPNFDDDLIYGAFDDFAQAAGPSVKITGTAAVRNTVRRRRTVQTAALSILSALIIAVPLATYAVTSHSSNAPPSTAAASVSLSPSVSPSPSPSPSVSPSASLSPSATTPPDSGPTLPAIPPSNRVDPRTQTILNASITMPAWPGYAQWCPTGVFSFAHGKASATTAYQSDYNLHYEASTNTGLAPVVYADLDGNSADEAVISVSCDSNGSVHPHELLAVRVMPNGTVRTLGFVVATNDHHILDYDDLTVGVSGQTVLVEVDGDHFNDGGPREPEQVRGYRFVGGAFQQVSGPTTFPAYPADITDVDLGNATIAFDMAYPCSGGCIQGSLVRMVNGVGFQTYAVKHADGSYSLESVTFTIQHTAIVTDYAGTNEAFVWVTEKGSGALTTAAVFAEQLGNGLLSGPQLVAVGKGGVTGIVDLTASGNTATVTVQTSSGPKPYGYRQNSSQTWIRVS